MSKRLTYILAATLIAASCAEFEPVFTGKYPDPPFYNETEQMFDPSVIPSDKLITIADLAKKFKEAGTAAGITDYNIWGWTVSQELWVKGRITTTDRSGNFYKSFYIQDSETGPGIEVKIGKNSLYNEYKLGQEVYINLDGLCVGEYGWKSGNYAGEGMVQIGLEDPSGEYSTSYIEHQYIISSHIYRGDPNDIQVIKPREVSVSDLPALTYAIDGNDETAKVRGITQGENSCIGSLITLKDLTYANEIFALLYIRGSESNKNSSNRIFLSDKTWGVDTWAISKTAFKNFVNSGLWDSAEVGNSGQGTGETLADVREELLANANAYSVSQYFNLAGCKAPVQVRTSGFSKFADLKMDKSAGWNNGTITLTGILSIYQGSYQFILTDNDNQFIQDVLNK